MSYIIALPIWDPNLCFIQSGLYTMYTVVRWFNVCTLGELFSEISVVVNGVWAYITNRGPQTKKHINEINEIYFVNYLGPTKS